MIYLNVVSFKNHIFSDLVNKIIVSGIEGELGIYPKHINLLTFIKPSFLKIFINKKIIYIYVLGGILQITYNKVIIISDFAIKFKKYNNKKMLFFLKNIKKKINKINKKKDFHNISSNFYKILKY
ncbi:ATP synthase F1 subunit epsilon [Buchnera aphidicola]|uniref:ATP synthase F1 subunit epsilon n=1 Tax=Buchnera aphidicola TaxID=9 RepID=UPI0031B840FD